MNISISNIAWLPEETEAVASLLVELNIHSIEIAPTTLSSDPPSMSLPKRRQIRKFWADRGIRIVAFQALLYGRQDLTLFRDPASQRATIDYLRAIMDLAFDLGASVLVFGSPKNRHIGDRGPAYVRRAEGKFFSAIGKLAFERQLVFCIEPNPAAYDCDYLQTSAEVLEVVHRIGSPGLGLHLDAAGMTLAGEDPNVIRSIGPNLIRHFHISEPGLQVIGSGQVPHEEFADALHSVGYSAHVSIEMRPERKIPGENVRRVEGAIHHARRIYGRTDGV